jgi:hypothetical protein
MALLARPGIPFGLTCWLLAAVLWILNPAPTRHTLARPISVPAATTNPYWAGYVGTRGPYSGVQASWTVPATSCSSSTPATAATYIWIGEGGYLQGLASPLIQAGTGSDCLSGAAEYHAFYEWYPGIYATDFPVPVRAGDVVAVSMREAQPDYWELSFRDLTTHASSSTATVYRADTQSADFIVERPTLCSSGGCGQASLARFGSITFGQLRVRDGEGKESAGLSGALSIALTDPGTDRVLAVPGRTPDATDLSVLWRSS